MRAIVVRAAVLAAAAGGLTASFLVPLSLDQPAAAGETLRMPAATRETTVSVFPAPGRPESSLEPVERAQPPALAARRPLRPGTGLSAPEPTLSSAAPARPRSPLVTRGPAPPIRPQTDERLLAELAPERPDDRSPRLLVPE
jgi:hypothetical protein